MAFDVVIAGGGFGGLYAARRLERRLPRYSARIIVVSDVNFLLYTPLLPGAAAGSLEPRHVVVPIREELEWADLRLGRVTGADPGVNELYMRTLDERDETLRYDQLIVALGSVSRVLPIPGLAEHALGFKTLADAIALRNRALLNLEIAESLPDDESRREYLTFLFVGAGYAGVEGIAELQDYVNDTIERYPRCRAGGHALDHRRHARPDHARDPREPRRVRLPGAARARDRAAHRHAARAHGRAQRGALDRRARAHTHGVLDGRGEAARRS